MTDCTTCRGTGFAPDTWPILHPAFPALAALPAPGFDPCPVCGSTGMAKPIEEHREALQRRGIDHPDRMGG